MNNEFKKDICSVCNTEDCSCEHIEASLFEEEPKVAVKRRVSVKLKNDSSYENGCDCSDECECEECNCNKKKAIAFVGAGIIAVAVAGGVLYLVKNKK